MTAASTWSSASRECRSSLTVRPLPRRCSGCYAGGTLGLSVWVAERPLEPFGQYIAALTEAGVAPPFPGAFDGETFKMAEGEVRTVLEGAGLASVEIRTIEHEVVWPDAESAALGILGTPFAPLLDRLAPERRDALEADLRRRFSPSAPGEAVRRTTAAVERARPLLAASRAARTGCSSRQGDPDVRLVAGKVGQTSRAPRPVVGTGATGDRHWSVP